MSKCNDCQKKVELCEDCSKPIHNEQQYEKPQKSNSELFFELHGRNPTGIELAAMF